MAKKAKQAKNRPLEAIDPELHTGAVENGPSAELEPQILPVWASSEPFGYEGSPADTQIVGGGGGACFDAEKAHSRRNEIGPGA